MSVAKSSRLRSRWPRLLARRLLLATLALVGLLALGAAAFWLALLFAFGPGSNRIVVRNASGSELTDVHVVLRDMTGRPVIDRTLPALAASTSAALRHSMNDSEALLEFSIGGTRLRFTTEYIDLWTGEGWVLEIQPDGSVKQGYDYPGFVLE